MSTAKDAPATNVSSTATQLRQGLNSALSSADSITTQGVQNLGLVHQARLSQLSRTAASLKSQYGADDPRVKSAEVAVAAGTATVARISIVNRQLITPAPVIAKEGWALHGRVFNAQLQPVSNLTIFLVDGQKTYQQQSGYAYTDASGYYFLNYAGAAGQSPAAAQLFVEIANKDGLPIYLSTTPFQPALGRATYQNITLPVGEKPLGDPPQAIRSVAFPNRDKKP